MDSGHVNIDPEYVNSRDLTTSFSPGLDYLAVCTKNGSITGEIETQFACTAPGGDIKCMNWLSLKEKGKSSLLPFGKKNREKKRKLGPCGLLVLGTVSGEVLALDVVSGQLKWRINDCHRGDVNALSYDTKSLFLFTAGADGTVSRIDLHKGERTKISLIGFDERELNNISSLSVSPDGKLLAVVSDRLKIFRCNGRGRGRNEWEIMKTFTGDLGDLRCVAFTKDGKHIISSASDRKEISIWKIDNGKDQEVVCLLKLDHPPLFLDTLGEAKGGQYIIGISEIGVVHYWYGSNFGKLRTANPVKVELVNGKGPLRTIFSVKQEKIMKVGAVDVNATTVSGLRSELLFRRMLLPLGTELRGREYFSWGIIKPNIFRDILLQTKDVCWAIAIITQLEAMLKLDGRLKMSDTLSIQALIDAVPISHLEMRSEEASVLKSQSELVELEKIKGSIKTIEVAGSMLIEKGTVLERFCPLDYELGMGDRTPVNLEFANRFKASKVEFYDLLGGIEENVEGEEVKINHNVFNHLLPHDEFEAALEELLKSGCPVACRILMTESYDGSKRIYNPTDDAMRNASGGHLMLLSGVGVDENGRHYWEFRDSFGKKWGDNGVIKVMRHRRIVTTFIKIEV